MIKAIETVYQGHRFRSRLEARWAVALNTAGVSYEYEPEGYRLDHVLTNRKGTFGYLPDFWLPDLGMFAEVKGDLDEAGLVRLCESAAALAPIGPTLVLGPMGDIDVHYGHGYWPYLMRYRDSELTTEPWDRYQESWCQPGVFAHRSEHIVSRWVSIRGGADDHPWNSGEQDWVQAKDQLLRGPQGAPISSGWARAQATGQEARFEHGGSPQGAVR